MDDPAHGQASKSGENASGRLGLDAHVAAPLFRLFRWALPSVHDWPGGPMSSSLYAYVLKVSRRQQVRLGLLTLALLRLSLAPLELQRRIVNYAVAHSAIELLLGYGGLYLALLLLQSGLKFLRDVYLYRIAEGVTRLLRRKFVRRGPLDGVEDGTKQAIISAEAEKVGGFVAESISLPLLQAGTVLSITVYMLAIEPLVALVAIVFLVPSVVAVGLSQPILNHLSRSKITIVRSLGQSVLRADRPDAVEDAEPDALVDRIYDLRLRFANLKITTKSFSQLITGLGLLSILLVGGWLAIQGQTEIGIIVAFMSGYERMTGPVRDLLNFYRRLSMMRMQYKLVAEAFA
jgi:ABC-type bacteriocin/lantibiotic exporter with double-glycine peptidase domain